MIVIWHFLIHGGPIANNPWLTITTPLVIGGVDLFVILSGFFLIKLQFKSIVRLAFIILIFSIINVIAILICQPDYTTGALVRLFKTFIFPFSPSSYWFLQVYFALVFLSPIINAAINSFNHHQKRVVLALLAIFNFYFCFFGDNYVDQHGYSLFNFIFLYLLGHALQTDPWVNTLSKKHIVIIMTVALFAGLVYTECINILRPSLKDIEFSAIPDSYSNPFTIIFCASIIIYLSRLSFHSDFINKLGRCSLGIYLLQEGIFGGWGRVVYDHMSFIFTNHPLHSFILLCVILFFSYWIASYIIYSIIWRPVNALCSKVTNLIPDRLSSWFRLNTL